MDKRIKSELESAQQTVKFLEGVLQSSVDGILITDSAQNILVANPAFSQVFGGSPEELRGTGLSSWLERFGSHYPEFWAEIEKLVYTTGECKDVLVEFPIDTDAKVFSVNASFYQYGASGKTGVVISIWHDVTEREKAEEEIIQSHKEWEDTFDIIVDAITIHDEDCNIIRYNKSAKEMLNLPILLGDNKKCYKYYHGTDGPIEECPGSAALRTGKITSIEMFEPHLNRYVEIRAIPRFDVNDQIIGILHIVRDITERKEMEEQLQAIAITDDLTGLFNRRGFFTLSEQQCKLADRTKNHLSLLYLDLDNLKIINDKLGHDEGDRAIKDVADVLRKSFRKSDIIARIGGDEFAVLITDPTSHEIETITTDKIKSNLGDFNMQKIREYILSLSMGMAHYNPENPCSIGDLITRADTLMYENKRRNK